MPWNPKIKAERIFVHNFLNFWSLVKSKKATSAFIDKCEIWPRLLSEAELLLISAATEFHSSLSIPSYKELFSAYLHEI